MQANEVNEAIEAKKDQKSFFDRLAEILNSPLPGTEAEKPEQTASNNEASPEDNSLLARVKEILNAPLPGSDTLNAQIAETEDNKLDSILRDISEKDVQENWWETDWAAFKAHQEEDRKGLNMKQRMDQEAFAKYQEQERQQFDAYQSKEFELFQAQQQAKLAWIQQQQLQQAEGVEVAGMVPPPPPVAPLPPEMPTPPWLKGSKVV